jgi:hypothetical protein
MERRLRQSQLPFAAVRRQQGRVRDESPDFGAVAEPEMSEGGVVFPPTQSSQIIVPGTPPESPESPYYRHDSQAAQRQPSTPSPPRQLTPEEIAYLQAEEQWRQERLQRQRRAELDQRSFQAGLRSERAFHEGDFPVTRTAPGRNPNQLDYSIPYQTPEYSWQHRMGITQQQQRDIDEQHAAIARAETAASEQRQQIRETRQEELDRLADLARQRDRDRPQGGGGSGSRRNSAITASKRKKIKQSKSKRKSKYTRKSNKNKMQRKKSQRRN